MTQLTERAELTIREGHEAEFAAAMESLGLPLLRALDGVGAIRFGQGVENPSKFLLLIEWASLEAHAAFNRHPVYAEFRALLAPYTVGGAMEHFNLS